jgi:hypothetical protein
MAGRVLGAVRRNIVAWIALFVALGGTGLAASHYIITSTKQIKPSVLRSLQGHAGASGPAGKNGVAGATGATGATGERGPAGTTGSQGSGGEEGSSGAPVRNVVARVRSMAPVMTTSTTEAAGATVVDPMSGSSWTQQPDEVDEVIGNVTYTSPPETDCSTGLVAVELYLGNVHLGVAYFVRSEHTETIAIHWSTEFQSLERLIQNVPSETLWLYEPGAATAHTMTAQVADTCGERGTSGGHFTIDSIEIDVLGAK